MSAPKLRKAMAELSQAIIDYPGDADLCDVCVAADQALTAYTNARAIKIARKDARRARKAARAKPAAGDDVTKNVARAIWAEHRAAGERAVVDAAAVDTLLYELTTASQRYGWWLHKRSGLPARSQADRDAVTETNLTAIATETARAALRALVLGDGEGAP